MNHQTTRTIQTIARLFIIGFCALIGVNGYWAIQKRAILLARSDNPYPILAEQRVLRGSIFDYQWQPLAETVGKPGSYTRQYPLAQAAAVVGYHSFNYGDTGLEAAFGALLSGQQNQTRLATWWQQQVLHRPLQGASVQTYLRAELQRQCFAALQGYTGAVVFVKPSNGEVLAIASAPSFDPNTINDDWDELVAHPEKRLLQRASQGLYPARQVFYPLFVALAKRYQTNIPAENTNALFSIATTLGVGFQSYWHDFGLDQAVTLPIATAAPVYPSDWLSGNAESIALVSPLHLAQVAATFANAGRRQPLRLVSQIQSAADGRWVEPPLTQSAVNVMPADVVAATLLHLAEDAQTYSYSATESTAAQQIGWSWGFHKQQDLAWVIVVENGEGASAAQLAQQILTTLSSKRE